jgi:dTMP kinase
MSKKGLFIVIDGTDGSGKATQTKLLVKRLQKIGKKVRMEDFPQYGQKSAGPAEDYLNGIYGTAEQLGPYIPSVFYAVDRFAAKDRINKHLDAGFIVISNRYVSANMGHQGGKLENSFQRHKFFTWLFKLEYSFFQIPKPDLTLILHVPAKTAQKLVDKKGRRFYIGSKKRDLHEKDLKHLLAAEQTYLEISKEFNYPLIECVKDENLLRIDEIHELIWKQIKNKI